MIRASSPARLVAADQVVSSATNFVYVVVAAAILSASDFGAFALGSSLFGLALGIVRTTSSERIATVRGPAADRPIPIVTASLLVSLAGFWVATALLLVVTGRGVVAVWLVAAPVILVQDRLRYAALRRRPGWALASDLAWLIAIGVLWVLVLAERGGMGADRITISLVVIGGPLVGAGVLLGGGRGSVTAAVERDLAATLAESRFVADSWLLAGAVFVSLAEVGAVASLVETGQARLLLLLFQPFFSLAYAGRLVILAAPGVERVRRWPWVLAVAAGVYSLGAGGLLAVATRTWTVPVVWRVGVLAFVVTAASQCARAFHQGVTDLARRSDPNGLVAARTVFAVLLVVTTAPLATGFGLEGVALAMLVAFAAGALTADRATRWRSLATGGPAGGYGAPDE